MARIVFCLNIYLLIIHHSGIIEWPYTYIKNIDSKVCKATQKTSEVIGHLRNLAEKNSDISFLNFIQSVELAEQVLNQ